MSQSDSDEYLSGKVKALNTSQVLCKDLQTKSETVSLFSCL